MKRKPFMIIRHGITMVRRNLQSYVMLSVTIVLSFSLLLGYLIYTDSALYNKYKTVFHKDRNIVSLYDAHIENDKVGILFNQLEELEDIYYYNMYETQGWTFENGQYTLEDGRRVNDKGITVRCIPNRVWGIFNGEDSELEVTYFDGRAHEGVVLNSGEALMDEITFYALGLDKMEEPVYHVLVQPSYRESRNTDEKAIDLTVKIVGTVPSSFNKKSGIFTENPDGRVSLRYDVLLYLSLNDVSMQTYPDFPWIRRLYFYTNTPELVTQAIDRLSYTTTVSHDTYLLSNFSASGVYQEQNSALRQMQTEARTKSIITAALLVLLGINLYSSFTNALNDRKFEIGVKRAIGATSWDIVRQFLYESIFVMIANVVLSITLVTNIMIVYKAIYESIPDEWGNFSQWIVYVTPYSIAMFAICSISLTIVFSLIFAYKSTQVEIVQYLKAE